MAEPKEQPALVFGSLAERITGWLRQYNTTRDALDRYAGVKLGTTSRLLRAREGTGLTAEAKGRLALAIVTPATENMVGLGFREGGYTRTNKPHPYRTKHVRTFLVESEMADDVLACLMEVSVKSVSGWRKRRHGMNGPNYEKFLEVAAARGWTGSKPFASAMKATWVILGIGIALALYIGVKAAWRSLSG